jgi:hypothetical protein
MLQHSPLLSESLRLSISAFLSGISCPVSRSICVHLWVKLARNWRDLPLREGEKQGLYILIMTRGKESATPRHDTLSQDMIQFTRARKNSHNQHGNVRVTILGYSYGGGKALARICYGLFYG